MSSKVISFFFLVTKVSVNQMTNYDIIICLFAKLQNCAIVVECNWRSYWSQVVSDFLFQYCHDSLTTDESLGKYLAA